MDNNGNGESDYGDEGGDAGETGRLAKLSPASLHGRPQLSNKRIQAIHHAGHGKRPL